MKLDIRVASLLDDLSAITAIRQQVFQVEQQVTPDLDFDGQDQCAIHLLAWVNEQPVGTLRIRALDEGTVKLERLAVLPQFRKQGIGKNLVQQAIAIAKSRNIQIVKIHAQTYIKHLYEQLGFEQTGSEFLEAGITHLPMAKVL